MSLEEDLNLFYSNVVDNKFYFPEYSGIRKEITNGIIEDLAKYYPILDKKKYNFLDIGCGAGINSLYASLLGFNTYSLDRENIISKLKFISDIHPEKINLNYIVTDSFPEEKLDISFDFVLNQAYLHVLNSSDKQIKNLEKMIEVTKPNGINLVSTFVNDNGLCENDSIINSLINSKEIFSIYNDNNWDIIRSGFNYKNKNNYILIARQK